METVAINETNSVHIEKSEVLNSHNVTSDTEHTVSKNDSNSAAKISKNKMKKEAKKARWLESKAERRYIF